MCVEGAPDQRNMFKEFLTPVIEASRVFNRATCKMFVDSMMSNLYESGVTFGAVELCFKKKGYALDQITYMLSDEHAKAWCDTWGFPQPNKQDECWISHKPGYFSKSYKRFSLDKSTKGYTREDIKKFTDSTKVSQKVKTQTLAFCYDVLDAGGHILSITCPLNIPFANKLKVFCIPHRPEGSTSTSPDEVVEFATSLGFSQDFSMIEAVKHFDLECQYTSVTIGRNGVGRSFGVEFTSKSKQGFSIALAYLKYIGLSNDSHIPKQLNGFHHIKLTFEKSKVTPKLYTWIGYSKYNDRKPQAKPSSRTSK